MEKHTKQTIIRMVTDLMNYDDPSHDIHHVIRVCGLAETIAKEENGDMDIVIAAALLHDIVVYPKNDSRSSKSSEVSAAIAGDILRNIKDYPKEKIPSVCKAISQCSFSKGIMPDFLESKILQDADKLEQTGATAIMRIFSSTGSMKRRFYDPDDPFAVSRQLDPIQNALDVIYSRSLKVPELMHTACGKRLAVSRNEHVVVFIEQVKKEITDSIVIF